MLSLHPTSIRFAKSTIVTFVIATSTAIAAAAFFIQHKRLAHLPGATRADRVVSRSPSEIEKSEAAQQAWERYEDAVANFSFKYPADFSYSVAPFDPAYGRRISFGSDPLGHFSVYVKENPRGVDLATFYKTSPGGFNLMEMAEEVVSFPLNNGVTGMKLINVPDYVPKNWIVISAGSVVIEFLEVNIDDSLFEQIVRTVEF